LEWNAGVDCRVVEVVTAVYVVRLIDHTAGRGEAALFYGALCLFVTIAVLRTGKQ